MLKYNIDNNHHNKRATVYWIDNKHQKLADEKRKKLWIIINPSNYHPKYVKYLKERREILAEKYKFWFDLEDA